MTKPKDLPPVQVVAEIAKIETRQKGIRITIDSNDLSPEEAAAFMQYRDQQGWMLFAPREITQKESDELADIPAQQVEPGQKSHGQRLRAVLFLLWQQKYKGKPGTKYPDSELLYASQMDRFIEAIKEQLE